MGRISSPQIYGFVVGLFFAYAIQATGVNAAVVVGDLGTLNVGTTNGFVGFVPTGSEAAQFEAALPGGGEVIKFDINSAANISGAAISINILDFIGISNLSFMLVQAGDLGSDFSTFAVLAVGVLTDGVLTLSYSGLTSGFYGLLFAGEITGSSGGFYAGNLVVAAVPLPPAVWLFLSALIGLIGVARKKSKRTIATTTHSTETPLGA